MLQISGRERGFEVQLVLAYALRHVFRRTCWTEHRMQHWVLDLITHGSQLQRVGDRPIFERTSSVLALYTPATLYFERQVCGQALSEAHMVFAASAATEAELLRLTGDAGYCHIEDPHGLVADPLNRLCVRFSVCSRVDDILAQGLMLECLGYLSTSMDIGPSRRRLAPEEDPGEALVKRVRKFLETHIEQAISVVDVATALDMSVSSLAHQYPKVAGETPYQAILRSKIAAAKRLLLFEGLNVQEVADRLSFSSPYNFSRAFKRQEGWAPSHYVIRHRT